MCVDSGSIPLTPTGLHVENDSAHPFTGIFPKRLNECNEKRVYYHMPRGPQNGQHQKRLHDPRPRGPQSSHKGWRTPRPRAPPIHNSLKKNTVRLWKTVRVHWWWISWPRACKPRARTASATSMSSPEMRHTHHVICAKDFFWQTQALDLIGHPPPRTPPPGKY